MTVATIFTHNLNYSIYVALNFFLSRLHRLVFHPLSAKAIKHEVVTHFPSQRLIWITSLPHRRQISHLANHFAITKVYESQFVPFCHNKSLQDLVRNILSWRTSVRPNSNHLPKQTFRLHFDYDMLAMTFLNGTLKLHRSNRGFAFAFYILLISNLA